MQVFLNGEEIIDFTANYSDIIEVVRSMLSKTANNKISDSDIRNAINTRCEKIGTVKIEYPYIGHDFVFNDF